MTIGNSSIERLLSYKGSRDDFLKELIEAEGYALRAVEAAAFSVVLGPDQSVELRNVAHVRSPKLSEVAGEKAIAAFHDILMRLVMQRRDGVLSLTYDGEDTPLRCLGVLLYENSDVTAALGFIVRTIANDTDEVQLYAAQLVAAAHYKLYVDNAVRTPRWG
jgi:hypothetical protein